jgi:hypothetical protein
MRKKIKYQGGITKRICQKLADKHKKEFRNLILKKERVFTYANRPINFEMISFSGATAFEDQLLSIYSFVHYAGVPIKWIIYSDGSYTQTHTDIFKREFPFVALVNWDVNSKNTNEELLKDYISKYGTAKKVTLIAGHQYVNPTIFIDSDIVFYPNIAAYLNNPLLSKGLWYVPDAIGNVSHFIAETKDSIYPFNFGMLIMDGSFNFDDVYSYLEALKGQYAYFSDQSAFEYAFRKQGAQILDPRQFIIDTEDQFDFSMKYHPGDMAMRHYTGPIRHKMWQKGWKWHFEN